LPERFPGFDLRRGITRAAGQRERHEGSSEAKDEK
jgi:hypothetical protein